LSGRNRIENENIFSGGNIPRASADILIAIILSQEHPVSQSLNCSMHSDPERVEFELADSGFGDGVVIEDLLSFLSRTSLEHEDADRPVRGSTGKDYLSFSGELLDIRKVPIHNRPLLRCHRGDEIRTPGS
jgi:hypothetical protein